MLTKRIEFTEESFPRRLIVLQIIIVLSFLFLIDNFGFPPLISYLTDVIWLILLIAIIVKRRKVAYLRACKNWIALFLLFTLLTLIINQQSFLLYLWGVRNNFRFYVFFLACVLFLRRKDVDSALRIIMVFYFINFFLCLYQYYVLGKAADDLGGIFGIQTGCNAYMNLFLVIVCAYQMLKFIQKKIGFLKLLTVVAIGCYLAALSELKIFFVELCVVTALAVLLTKFSWRKLFLIVGCIGLLLLAANLMYTLFPQWENFFTIERIYNNITDASGYTGTGDLNRLSAISSINKRFFNGDLFLQLSGYGLGSCEYSLNFDFLLSRFFSVYSRLHYVWLSNAWMYLETGYIGLVFLNGFFVLTFVISSRIKPGNDEESVAINLARIISVCAVIMAVYNASLRDECGYLVYFVLSIPLVLNKERAEPDLADRRLITVECVSPGMGKAPLILRAQHGGYK
jgi:hypothetical protein